MIVARRLFFHHDDIREKSVVVNGVSGAFDVLSPALARELERHRGCELPDGLRDILRNDFEVLRQRGYLFDSTEDEESTLRGIRRSIEAASPPLTKFVICPTYACNLACPYCYEGDLTKRSATMSSEQLEAALRAIEVLKAQPEVKRHLYELFGGEPLLPSTHAIVARLLAGLNERDEQIAIVTNGTHIDTFLPLFMEYSTTVESLQITIDGPKAIHDQRRVFRDGSGSFERIAHGVDQLLAAGFFVRLRVNVDRRNLAHIQEFLDFVERRDWTMYRHFTCGLAPVTLHTQLVQYDATMREDEIVCAIERDFPALLRSQPTCNMGVFRVLSHAISVLESQPQTAPVLPSFTYCEATEGSVYVFGPDGAIYACPDSVISRRWAVGEFWPQFKLDQQRVKSWRRDIFSTPECRDCNIATLCGGGCAFVPMDRESAHPFCNGARESLDAYLSTWLARRYPAPAQLHN